MIAGFDPTFDDALWTLDWLREPVAQVPVGDADGGYRVVREYVESIDVFGRPYQLDPPLDVRALYDPQGVLWMSDTPQERMMMHNNAARSGGHVLVGGAGLGLYPQYVLNAESFTVVERSPVVLKLVGPVLQAVMAARGVPLRFIVGDVALYLEKAEAGAFDTIFLDTWARLDATLLPGINRLRDAAGRHLAPGGRVLLWGYRWMVRLFEEASAAVLMMPPGEREAWLAEQQAANPRAVALLAPVVDVFKDHTIQRWELDEAVGHCREWVVQYTG